MIEPLLAGIVNESKWLTVSMGAALLAAATLLWRYRGSEPAVRRRVEVAMNLFFGVTIGTMALGHLLAVTTKLGMGTLEGPTALFYLIGIALAVPSWWLIGHTRVMLSPGDAHGRTTLTLNIALAIVLLALGPQNVPLAVPAALNIAYHLHARRTVGWAIVSLAVVTNGILFIGSLIFWASGQSFEQFNGMQ